LHLDLNEKWPISLDKGDGMFTVMCGDLSGSPSITKRWISKNVGRGVFVSGNHLVYNCSGNTIDQLREEMAKGHGLTAKVTYLDCMTKSGVCSKLVDGVLFVGSTLYTDFLLPCVGPMELASIPDKTALAYRNMCISERHMNDYRWGRIDDPVRGSTRPLAASDLRSAFEKSMEMMTEVIERFADKSPNAPVFVVTHYCPSPKCISDEYVDSDLNASYASDLEKFIADHPNIRCWACGHVHTQKHFKIGNCLVVMNPRGYLYRAEDSKFHKDLVVDTDDWSVSVPEFTKDEVAEYAKRSDLILRYLW
jgi:hypothetical protein